MLGGKELDGRFAGGTDPVCSSGHELSRASVSTRPRRLEDLLPLEPEPAHDLEEAGVVGQTEILGGAGYVPVVPF